MTPTFTTFSFLMPSNLITVADFRAFASKAFNITCWKSAAKRYAAKQGGAHVLRADGSLMVFTKTQAGKVTQKTYKPNKWGWEAN